ncbi:NAD binding domain of 6-phosphogluconate dehydrogenase-domain-containing protein [Aspergillus ambiguus]|uniref:putative 3-hydroxyisobutyrate dehydrogenase n=1 Tax=Aspergillus ambiguus TaxID=176160 RepID=UPI003CCE29F0
MGSASWDTIGFIGLGAMGRPMAQQLLAKIPNSTQLYIFDIVEEVMDEFVALNPSKAIAAESPRHVAERSQVIISMVPEGSHVHAVYLQENSGVCSTALHDKLLIDCSTIDTATSLAVKDYIAANHNYASFYDAPVSGGVLGAQKGTIAFFLGCAETDPNLPVLTDILCLMGKQVIACGGPSLGLSAKLCNNYLSGLIAIADSEALNIGIRAGLDPRVLSNVFGAGTAQNAICDKFNPCPGVVADAPSSNGYTGGFKIQLMRKDFSLAVSMADQVGARLVLGDAGLKTYEEAANDSNCKDLDSRVVFRFLGGNESWAEKFSSPC